MQFLSSNNQQPPKYSASPNLSIFWYPGRFWQIWNLSMIFCSNQCCNKGGLILWTTVKFSYSRYLYGVLMSPLGIWRPSYRLYCYQPVIKSNVQVLLTLQYQSSIRKGKYFSANLSAAPSRWGYPPWILETGCTGEFWSNCVFIILEN